MRPIDQKLKYQVDKLIKTATTGASGEIEIIESYQEKMILKILI